MARLCVCMIGAAVGLHTLALAQEARIPAAVMPPAPPSVYRLTLEDAQRLALANNTSLILGRLGVQEKSIAADAARRDYFPKLLGNVYYFPFQRQPGQSRDLPYRKFGEHFRRNISDRDRSRRA
jgi:hypothetical protein